MTTLAFTGKLLLRAGNFLEVRRQPGADSFQMRRRDAAPSRFGNRDCADPHNRIAFHLSAAHQGSTRYTAVRESARRRVFPEILSLRSYNPPHFQVLSIPA